MEEPPPDGTLRKDGCLTRLVTLAFQGAVTARARLSYITDLELRLGGGGSYAVNWHAFDQLRRRFAADYAGPLTPRPLWLETTVSKIRRRVLHRRGRFAYFSPASLSLNAEMAAPHEKGVDAIVYRSAARWCRCRPEVPYFVYLDVAFHTFFHNTFSSDGFETSDLERIWDEEAQFLEGAAGVFFESQWGLNQARDAYGLRGSHYFAIGRGGIVDPPDRDSWNGSSTSLLSIAVDFRQKGGDITLAAYRILKERFPSLTWHIVGGMPGGDWASCEGILYEGALSPDIPAERNRLREVLAGAFVLVHPTREDTSPLVLTEAAYFGCPAISVNRFAIPELVEDGKSGLLIDAPAAPEEVARAIARLLDDRAAYLGMRKEARARALARHTWDTIGAALCDRIEEKLAMPEISRTSRE